MHSILPSEIKQRIHIFHHLHSVVCDSRVIHCRRGFALLLQKVGHLPIRLFFRQGPFSDVRAELEAVPQYTCCVTLTVIIMYFSQSSNPPYLYFESHFIHFP